MFENCCNLNTLTILILIILQFGKKGEKSSSGESKQLIDNDILFIITLLFLCCYKSRMRNSFY
ncbi:hypothetical protein CPAST_c29100 [Clostridium pasteurianum DSM 525 = ATCC 6013]|uniref:Uncharacterized protein n=1 Tax=Clostridium pasteurianum DSM 525 = ATCC 6013 TaxID=1262449 RepID=A0A0H3J4X9_CLOPA|nr:hypothetical protein [Clostridium pasteurianum]AJA48976.1 hypothetical protein CPAST_c29100 [Clostridium pasteurianum DSM 525 = ATCC 6013]AJA52964.1 hypothetical protein CLPA_c29100 [Clostridium pasteurianum DSM 525 = ATCC 6013]AOZ76183.1 hypothetical protein AQ983_14145 [Clostridium pasteurianum DSM 525 = ATCC 6013]AOZ79979.1 hypothetical protein AQ984_14140 [Clostridium pasteurianum]ELP60272.1 hypothetical protein F502_06532 [Clostridium pasteurianum DSM 525 = ATCC 6013]